MSLRLIKYFRFPSFIRTDWSTRNPLLNRGEVAYELDTAGTEIIGMKIGPGLWNDLGYFGWKMIPKTVRLNVTGAASSGNGVGIEIEEDGAVTGYIKTNSARSGFLFNTPASSYDGEFLFSSLSANRTYTLPDATGTIALAENTLSTALPSTNIWVGNASGIATQRVMSGDGTLSNTGVFTLSPVSLTTKVTGILPVANGGTGTSSVFTEGRVIFAGASGIYSQDSAFNWDSSTKILSFGVARPVALTTPENTGSIYLGFFAGLPFSTGTYNVGIGDGAAGNISTGQYNSFYGANAGSSNSTGSENTFIGRNSGTSLTIGQYNTAVGSLTLSSLTSSSYNTAIGYNAGRLYPTSQPMTAATKSLFIGANASASGNGYTKEIVIGADAVGNGSNTVTIGDATNTANYLTGTLNLLTAPSNDDTVNQILVRDSAGIIRYRTASSIGSTGNGHTIYNGATSLTQRTALTFTNGLSASDNTTETLAKLGGALTENTNITGSFYLNMNPSNVSIFGSSPTFGSGSKVMYIGVATTPPSTAPTTGIFLWVEQVNGNYELRIMDSAGNIKGLS